MRHTHTHIIPHWTGRRDRQVGRQRQTDRKEHLCEGRIRRQDQIKKNGLGRKQLFCPTLVTYF